MLTEQEKQDLALTIAGEIHPGLTQYGTEEAREEIANILASIENRNDLADSSRYATRSDVVKAPAQYSTWNTKSEQAVARANYREFKDHIDAAVEDFYSGKLQATAPHATNYWSPIGMRHITGGRRSEPKWAPSITNRTESGPHVFGTHKSLVDDLQILDINSRIAGPEHGAPVPSGRGVSLSEHLADRIESYPGPSWSDQFAPGPKVAPRSAKSHPVRDDYPTGPTNPEPWQDTFAPAPRYAHRTASPARFDKTFAPSDPQAPPLTPGTSNTGKAAAYRGLADTMLQASIGGLDGRTVTQSQAGIDRYGPVHPEHGLSTPPPDLAAPRGTLAVDSVPIPRARPQVSAVPEFTPPVPSRRPPAAVPFMPPVPKERPQSMVPKPTARRFVPTHSTVPIPKPRPAANSALPMMPLHRGQMHQRPSPYTGPKKQIFDFVLRQLLNPKPGAN